MAYFANGCEGPVLDDQCADCIYGSDPCPIAFVQMVYNYDAVNNETATSILNCLVNEEGTCRMYKIIKRLENKT